MPVESFMRRIFSSVPTLENVPRVADDPRRPPRDSAHGDPLGNAAPDAKSCESVDQYDTHDRACACDDCLRKTAASGTRALTEEEQKRIEELKRQDARVRRHEQAHKAAAGQYARGSPRFDYETGPDGKPYAVGGEVQVDTTPIPNDPQATIRKAEIIQRAALAPQDPSDQDRKVAAEAAKMKAEAQKALADETGGNPLQVRTASYSPASYPAAPAGKSPRPARPDKQEGRHFDREA